MPYRSYGERRARRRDKVVAAGPGEESRRAAAQDRFERELWKLGERVRELDGELRELAWPDGRLKGRAFGIAPLVWRSATRRVALKTRATLKDAKATLAALEKEAGTMPRTVSSEALRQPTPGFGPAFPEMNRTAEPSSLVATMRQGAGLGGIEVNRERGGQHANERLASEILRLTPNRPKARADGKHGE
ncbi:MAG: hypothetical protein H6923_06685 [Alphaproteobacteria bacterium]|nr:hypothetical protein [Alphaproteobacteria bacterium]